MNRTTLLFISFLTLIFGTITLAIAGQRYEFPQQSCLVDPPMRDGEVACKYLGSPDDIPTYSLHYGRTGQQLLEFIRSAVVLQGELPNQIAVNSYEGSNYTDCYVFWDANNPSNMLSLASIWKPILENQPKEEKASITIGDHTYYMCIAWMNDSLKVEAGWRREDFSYLEATANISSSGTLTDISFKSDPLNSLVTGDGSEVFTYRALDIVWREEVWKLFPPQDKAEYGSLSWDDVTLNRIEYCPDESPYICIWTPLYAFAVPKELTETGPLEWEINGHTFERIGKKKTIALLGVEIDDVYVIKTPVQAFSNGRQLGMPGLSLYSPTYGLIGFEDVRTGMYVWSSTLYGFGHVIGP